MNQLKALQMIDNCLLKWSHFAFADAYTHNAVWPSLRESLGKSSGAFIVESSAVYESFVFRKPEEPRPFIAGLRVVSNRARLNKAEAQCCESFERNSVFIKTCRQANGIGEPQTKTAQLSEIVAHHAAAQKTFAKSRGKRE